MSQDASIVAPALGLLVASGLWLARSRRRPPLAAGAAVALASAVWLRADQYNEGEILISFTREHGLVEADLLVPVVVGAAVALRWRRQRADRRTAKVESVTDMGSAGR